MAQRIARDDDSRGYLITWWDGDVVESDAQLMCEVDEIVVFIDGDEVIAKLGPGRYGFSPPPAGLESYVNDAEEIAVAFITTSVTRIEASGALEDLDDELEPQLTLSVALRIVDAAAVMPLLDKLDDEESLEDWLGDELLLHADGAISEAELSLEDLSSGANAEPLAEQTAQRARAVLAEYGIEVQKVEGFTVTSG